MTLDGRIKAGHETPAEHAAALDPARTPRVLGGGLGAGEGVTQFFSSIPYQPTDIPQHGIPGRRLADSIAGRPHLYLLNCENGESL